jgi:hypothetical protein
MTLPHYQVSAFRSASSISSIILNPWINPFSVHLNALRIAENRKTPPLRLHAEVGRIQGGFNRIECKRGKFIPYPSDSIT